MRLDHIAGMAVEHLLGRLLRRALVAVALAVAAIVAIYQGGVAGTLALQAEYGATNAHLIVGASFVALAVIFLAIFLAMRGKSSKVAAPALSQQRELQLAMLVEAVMLGYALARKSDRAR